MKYKIVAIDLDGTLLNNEHVISDYTADVLKKVSDLGVKIVIATGRSYTALVDKIEKLGLQDPVVCYNGSMVRNGGTGEILHNLFLDPEVAKGLIEISRREDLYYQVFIDGDFHFEKEGKESEYYRGVSGLQGVEVDFDNLKTYEFTKTMFISEKERLASIEDEVRSKFSDRAYIAYSRPHFLEVMNSGASKSKALDLVVKDLGLSSDDVIAFGDAQNDADMIAYAGHGVVMKNGLDELKEKYPVTDFSNDEDGVAKYLEKLINE